LDRRELAYRFMYGRVLDIGCGDAVYLWGGRPPDFVDRRELAYRFMYGRVLDIGCGDAVYSGEAVLLTSSHALTLTYTLTPTCRRPPRLFPFVTTPLTQP